MYGNETAQVVKDGAGIEIWVVFSIFENVVKGKALQY
jgi:hypothetical protein